MSNHLKPGSASRKVADRHGRRGDVPISASVPPQLKDDLVAYCLRENVTQRDTVEAALWMFLAADHAEKNRWYGG